MPLSWLPTMTASSIGDSVCGTLIGLACGDAVGVTSEFQRRGTFPKVTGMVGGGAHELKPGQWTDDTSLALCLAQSLIELARHDPRDQLTRYLRWAEEGRLSSTGECFDIGKATSSSLRCFRLSGFTAQYCGSTAQRSSGNGSLMRLAPAPMLLRLHPGLAITVAGDTSRTTHASPATVDSCRYFAGLLIGAMGGASKEHLLAEGGFVPAGLPEDYWTSMDPPLDPEVAEVALGASHAHREPPEEETSPPTEGTIWNSGYVVRTLDAALWAFGRSASFEEGCLMIANLGDDADTVAAVYGQLAGAYYGASGIPSEWRTKLALRGLVESMAEELYDMSYRVDPDLDPAAPVDSHATSGTLPRPMVTRFEVKPRTKGASRDYGGAYWGGGVAAYYRMLEDGYIAISDKRMRYKSVEAFDRDVEALLRGRSGAGGAAAEDDDDLSGKQSRAGATRPEAVDEAVEGWIASTESMTVAAERREALMEEFAERLLTSRAQVEAMIQP